MFLKFIKDLSIKRVLNNSSDTVNFLEHEKRIQTVGILIDETTFSFKEELIQKLLENGFFKEKLSILVFKDNYKKKEDVPDPHFSFKSISWIGLIESQPVKDFITKDFDLLVSYYSENKAPLQLVTHLSKAKFKVGFASVDKRHNHFMIDTKMEDHTSFTNEMFKYLRILNKL